MVEVVGTDEFEAWYLDLSAPHDRAVTKAIERLEIVGLALGDPYSSAIKGATFALRELRIKSSRHAIRVLYAFDPKRQALLIIGGDKTGDERFYERMIPVAERLWGEHTKSVT